METTSYKYYIKKNLYQQLLADFYICFVLFANFLLAIFTFCWFELQSAVNEWNDCVFVLCWALVDDKL